MLEALRRRAARSAIFLDFDGSLSAIVERPELASPAEGAREVLGTLVGRYGVVAVVTGRRSEEVARLVNVPGVRYEGLYGMQEAAPDLMLAILPEVERAAAVVPEAWVENKRVSVAVHYRQAPSAAAARTALVGELRSVASRAGLELIEGKMVVELVPPDHPMKGGAIERVVGELSLEGALFAGDDVADADAFAALDRLAKRGLVTLRVAVAGTDTPNELIAGADIVVDGPAGLVELLRSL